MRCPIPHAWPHCRLPLLTRHTLPTLSLCLCFSINTEHMTHLFTGLTASTASRKKPSCIQSSFEMPFLTLYPAVTCDSSLPLTLNPWMGVSQGQTIALHVAQCSACEDETMREERRGWIWKGATWVSSYSLPEDRSLQQNHLPSKQIRCTRKEENVLDSIGWMIKSPELWHSHTTKWGGQGLPPHTYVWPSHLDSLALWESRKKSFIIFSLNKYPRFPMSTKISYFSGS